MMLRIELLAKSYIVNEEYVQTACEKHLNKELHAFKYLFFLKVKCGHVYAGGKEVLFEYECVHYYCVRTCVCEQRDIQQHVNCLMGGQLHTTAISSPLLVIWTLFKYLPEAAQQQRD